MDTVFIKMCEKAEKIQALKPVGNYAYDAYPDGYSAVFYLPVDEKIALLHYDNDERHWMIGDYHDDIEGAVWLPTQAQLQGMSGLSWVNFDKACESIAWRYGGTKAMTCVETKEQAGILVIMEQHGKTWNGEEWL